MKNTNYLTLLWILSTGWMSSCGFGPSEKATTPPENEKDTVIIEKVVNVPVPEKPREISRADRYYLITDSLKYLYDLNTYHKKYRLPYVLETASGLTYISSNLLALVEDEGGKLYEYDIQKKKITHTIAFSKPGDFEGVALKESTYYAIKSNGHLYKFPRSKKDKVKSRVIKTPLSTHNNVEGLTYDSRKNRLLIATKQSGDIKGHKAKGKAVFAYDLKKDKFKKKPILEISQNKLYQFYTDNRDLDYDPAKVKFKPSGVAIHPKSRHLYALASTGKLLAVMDFKGNLIATYPISPKLLIQPEGICFAPNGDLFICSEGQGERGYILHYKMLTR